MGQPKFAKEIEESERNIKIKEILYNNKSKSGILPKTLESFHEEKQVLQEKLQNTQKQKEYYAGLFIITLICLIFLLVKKENWWVFIIGIIIGWFLPKK